MTVNSAMVRINWINCYTYVFLPRLLFQVKVAEWSDETRFLPVAAKFTRLRTHAEFERNKTYIVTAIIEEPYVMEREAEDGEILEGNDRYEGYCKDLADLVSKKLGINCNANKFKCVTFNLCLINCFR
jgi:hypothetical protein